MIRQKIMIFTLAFLYLWTHLSAVSAENASDGIDKQRLDKALQYARDQFEQNEVIGGAVGIVYKDELIYSEGIGTTRKSEDLLPTEKTVYFAASVTKAFTATAILKLHEEGKLDINKPVYTYIPWFQLKPSEASEKLTLRHLLIHSAGGVGSFQTDGIIFAKKSARDNLEDYIRLFDRIEMTEEPGETGSYCNGCYDILGLVIEYVTGMSYYDYMRTEIFEPLGMNQTVFGQDLDKLEDADLAQEYTWFFARKVHMYRAHEAFGKSQDPDGGMYSTIEDLSKFLAFQLGYGQENLLTPDTIEGSRRGEVSTELGTAEYTASGFEVKQIKGTTVYYKTGDGTGSASEILLIPDHDLGIILLIGEFHPEIQEQITDGMAAILLGYEAPPIEVPFTLGKLYGIAAIVLTLLGVGIIGLLIWRIIRRRLGMKKLSQATRSMIVWGIAAAPFWYLLLGVRLTSIGFYGYPYDLAIGLVLMAAACTLWALHHMFSVLLRGFKYGIDKSETMRIDE